MFYMPWPRADLFRSYGRGGEQPNPLIHECHAIQTCNSVTFYFMKEKFIYFSNNSRKCRAKFTRVHSGLVPPLPCSGAPLAQGPPSRKIFLENSGKFRKIESGRKITEIHRTPVLAPQFNWSGCHRAPSPIASREQRGHQPLFLTGEKFLAKIP